jgi:hypothetical protein
LRKQKKESDLLLQVAFLILLYRLALDEHLRSAVLADNQ